MTEKVAGYSDLVEIARGGDSIVYRAHQATLDRDVAIKVLLVDDSETVRRFRRELELTVRLGQDHPNIVTVLDTGITESGRPCIVLPLVDRGSLQDILTTHGPLAPTDVRTVGLVIADALAFAHDQGVLHRDVKPQNILALPTSYVLADFGIARLSDSAHTASVEQISYRHASPQAIDGQPPTAADDLWSLGSTLHTLLDGRPPFASDDAADDTALAYLRRARTADPRPLDQNAIDPTLIAVIERALAKEPADRYASARDMHEALSRVQLDRDGWGPDPSAPAPKSVAPLIDSPEVAPELPPAQTPDPPADPVDTAASHPVDTPPNDPAPAPADAHPPEPVSPWAPVVTPASSQPEAGTPATSTPTAPETPEPSTPAPTTPAPTHPQVTSRSALAQGAATDVEPTGRLSLPDTAIDPAAPVGRIAPAQSTPRTRMRWIVGAAAIGLGLGSAYAILNRSDRNSTPPTPTNTSTLIPSADSTTSATPVAPVADPKLTAVIVNLRDRGSSVELEWRDPSNGTASFIVTQTVGTADGQPRALAEIAAKTTNTTIDGLNPATPRLCFVVLTRAGSTFGTSQERCLSRS